MLTAVGIDGAIDVTAEGYSLFVEEPRAAEAIDHLQHYEQERRVLPPQRISFTPRPGAWWGSLLYVLVLLLPPFVLAQGWLATNPYEAATVIPARVQAGEWWRALTALTLHWDAAHLLGNLGGGAFLGYSAAQIWGSARAWLLIFVSAVAANLVEGLLNHGTYASAGASTAVFAALGLVAAFTWRTRGRPFGSPWARWAPLIAGVALLGFFGAGSSVPVAGMPRPEALPFEDSGVTNVLSHLLGFCCGVLMGALAASTRGARIVAALPRWAAVLLTVVPLSLAWMMVINAA